MPPDDDSIVVFNKERGVYEPSEVTVDDLEEGGGAGASSLSDLADVDVDTRAAGDVLQWDGASWIAGPVMVASTNPLDNVDFSHPKSDTFSEATLDPKWGPATSAAGLETLKTFNSGRLFMEPAASGAGSTGKFGGFGIAQVAPTGAFRIEAKILDGGGDDDVRAGIYVASTSTSKAHILGTQLHNNRAVNANGLAYSETAEWGSFDGYDQYTGTPYGLPTWYAIEWRTNGDLVFFLSQNGTVWRQFASRSGQVPPDRIGLAMWANQSDTRADHIMAVDWFRVIPLG